MELRKDLELPINFSGNWVSKEFYYINGLNGTDREMLSMIKNLDNGRGCTASNNYLSNILGISDRQVQNVLKKLKDMKLVNIILKNNTDRQMFLADILTSPLHKMVEELEASKGNNEAAGGTKEITGGTKETSWGGEETFVGGTKETSYNNKDNNKSINLYSDSISQAIGKLYAGKKCKATRDKKLPAILKKHGLDEIKRVIERYNKEVQGKDKQYILNEGTFWNGRYVDYLDSEYTDNAPAQKRKIEVIVSDNDFLKELYE